MRVLVVGAGAVGGYFGGRLLDAGRDVTFLVHPRRALQLQANGLVIRSSQGDVSLPDPPVVTAEALISTFDLVLVSCKAYDLDDAMTSFSPAVGRQTTILPLLNGIRHLEVLDERFGADRVIGGQCLISSALSWEGHILHLNDSHDLSFGERDGSRSARIGEIESLLAGAGFQARASDSIVQEMWEKWIFIASGAGATCLFRASVGDIVEAGAQDVALELIDECAAIAAANGIAPRTSSIDRSREMLARRGSALVASMLRDMEHGRRTEVDHIFGDFLRRGDGRGLASTLLLIAYANGKVYEARRTREAGEVIKGVRQK